MKKLTALFALSGRALSGASAGFFEDGAAKKVAENDGERAEFVTLLYDFALYNSVAKLGRQ